MSEQNFDSSSITMDEARNALGNPEKGSLRVLKALGRLRDQYMGRLVGGAFVLEVSSDVEQVAAEAALKDYSDELAADGEAPPRVSITRAKPDFK
ncbi:MAG: hypothetical protein LBP95_03810 [Deltaproteobacteria bacterium]|nr:hypothetical protein [Deltaproteobacteria bacterium]